MIDHYVIILLLWILPSCFLTSRVKPLQFLWGLSFPVSKSKPTETFKGFLYGCLHRRLASRQFGNESPLHILNVKIWAVTNSYKFQKFGSILWKLTKINKKKKPPPPPPPPTPSTNLWNSFEEKEKTPSKWFLSSYYLKFVPHY